LKASPEGVRIQDSPDVFDALVREVKGHERDHWRTTAGLRVLDPWMVNRSIQ
jgi:hypothetical protein